MAKPIKTYYGGINLDRFKEAYKYPQVIRADENYGDSLEIKAARWEDGSISIQVFNKETRKSTNIGKLFESKPFVRREEE